MTGDPHGQATIEQFGAPVSRARFTVIALHGRGASAADMRSLADHIGIPDVAYIAPTAGGRSWWPTSFLAPHQDLQPHLDSALTAVTRCVSQAMTEGAEADRLILMGFSQGACLALEYGARSDRSLKAAVGLSGGLLGTGDLPDGAPSEALYGHTPKAFDYPQRREGVSVYLGCHERDPHIPLARVRETATTFDRLGASTVTGIFPGSGHGVVSEEISHLRGLLNGGP